jgi:DNA-binding Lrp family transcriptional regulator
MHTPTERCVLRLYQDIRLSRSSKYTLGEISELTGASPATISDTVQKLVKEGVLVRTRVGNVSRYCAAVECIWAVREPRCERHYGMPMMGSGE